MKNKIKFLFVLLIFVGIFLSQNKALADQVATPVATPAGGTYATAQTVNLSDSTPTAAIWYTTDGSDPISGGGGTTQLYDPLQVIAVPSSLTIKALAFALGMTDSPIMTENYLIAPAQPTVDLTPGTPINVATDVNFTSSTPGATICWTRSNGGLPSDPGIVADAQTTCSSMGLTLPGDTYKVIAVKDGIGSSILVASYPAIPIAPTVLPAPGPISAPTVITFITHDTGALACWTSAGSGGTPSDPGMVDGVGGTHCVASGSTYPAIPGDRYKVISVLNSVASSVYTAYYPLIPNTPTANPISGTTISSNTDITFGTTTTGSQICYIKTTDGSIPADPGTDGYITICSNPISLMVVNVEPGARIKVSALFDGVYSAPLSAIYPFMPSVPVASPTPGPISAMTIVTLTSPGSTICWSITTDGSTPVDPAITGSFCAASPEVLGSVSAGTKIKMRAVFDGVSSAIVEADYPLATGTINGACGSSNGGTFSTAPTANLCSAGTASALSGLGPWTWNCTGLGSGYSSASCSASITSVGAQVATPTASPAAGTYSSTQNVTLSTSTGGATIYYTTDGSTPTTSSQVYTSGQPVYVPFSMTVKAMAVESGMTNSGILTSAYTISGGTAQVATPVGINPAPGLISAFATPTFSTTTPGAQICWTRTNDNSTPPDPASATGNGTICQSSGSTILLAPGAKIKLIAVLGGVASSVYEADYPAQAAAPVASPIGGTYSSIQNVILSSATLGSTIYYTNDGSNPTTSSAVYNGSIAISQNTTLKAIAAAANNVNSAVMSATYVIIPDTTPPVILSNLPINNSALSSGTKQIMVSVVTDENATCKYDTKSGTSYGSMVNYFTDSGTTHSFTATGLVDGASYGYYVRCKDLSNNFDATDYLVSFSVTATPVVVPPLPTPTNGGSSKSDSSSSKSKSKSTTSPRTISDSKKDVTRGMVLIQRGKKFSKSSPVSLHFSNPKGGYYPPQMVNTSSNGSFVTSYRVNKPRGLYSWFAIDIKSGKQSKIIKYTVR